MEQIKETILLDTTGRELVEVARASSVKMGATKEALTDIQQTLAKNSNIQALQEICETLRDINTGINNLNNSTPNDNPEQPSTPEAEDENYVIPINFEYDSSTNTATCSFEDPEELGAIIIGEKMEEAYNQGKQLFLKYRYEKSKDLPNGSQLIQTYEQLVRLSRFLTQTISTNQQQTKIYLFQDTNSFNESLNLFTITKTASKCTIICGEGNIPSPSITIDWDWDTNDADDGENDIIVCKNKSTYYEKILEVWNSKGESFLRLTKTSNYDGEKNSWRVHLSNLSQTFSQKNVLVFSSRDGNNPRGEAGDFELFSDGTLRFVRTNAAKAKQIDCSGITIDGTTYNDVESALAAIASKLNS